MRLNLRLIKNNILNTFIGLKRKVLNFALYKPMILIKVKNSKTGTP